MRLVIALGLGFDYTSDASVDMGRFSAANHRMEQTNRQKLKTASISYFIWT